MPSMALALGAGAGEGLDSILTRMMAEAKMKQLDAAQAETVRSHTANESIDRERIAAGERERLSRDAMTNRNYQDQSDRAMRDDGRALAEQIPGDTFLPSGDSAITQLEKAGQGSLLRMKSSLPSTSTVGASTLPGDDNPAGVTVTKSVPSQDIGRIKLRTQAQSEKAIADQGAADTRKREDARTEETSRHNRAMENKPPAAAVSIVPTADGIFRVPRSGGPATPVQGAGGDTLQRPDPAQVTNRRDMATAVGSHFDDANHLIDEADRRGLLGPLAGRTFADFLAGKVGSTGNAEDDNLLGDLRTSMSMIRSGTASLHGRAGANMGIAHDIEKKMDEGHMSADELRGSMKALKSWVDTYAKGTKTGTAPAGGGNKKVKKYDLNFNEIP